MTNGGPAKNWCFTVNNPTDDDVTRLEVVFGDALAGGLIAQYVVYGFEIGAGGVHHIQGFLSLKTKERRGPVKSAYMPRAHMEVMRGTALQAANYCKKDGDFIEAGELLLGSGRRSDLVAIRNDIRAGATNLQVAEGHFSQWVQYRRSFDAYRALLDAPRTWKSQVFLLVGATGCGKTRFVHAVSTSLWVAFDNTLKWFDGYSGQEDVLFDDFTGVGADMFGLLLRLCDRYPMDVPVKGGSVRWAPKRIFFTSNLPDTDWFTGINDVQRAAWNRRVDFRRVIAAPLEFDAQGQPIE